MLLKRRILAALVDYLIIVVYALVLFSITITLFPLEELSNNNPISGQLIGLLSLTLPVFLYFILMESSKYKASLGKLALNIKVNSKTGSVLKRNVFKLLPWEVAHLGVHWMFYYNSNTIDEPAWLWMALVIPQATALFYFVSIIYTKGKSSIYDKFSCTSVTIKN